MIPAIGTGFLPFIISTPPTPVPLPVTHVGTYASVGGPAPIVTPLLFPDLTEQVIGGADAEAEYGIVSNAARITVVSLNRTGVYSALLVDAVELLGGTEACATTPQSGIAAGESRPVSTFVGE